MFVIHIGNIKFLPNIKKLFKYGQFSLYPMVGLRTGILRTGNYWLFQCYKIMLHKITLFLTFKNTINSYTD